MAKLKEATECTNSKFKVGDRVYSPCFKESGEIAVIREYNNPYCQGINYHVILDSDNKKKDKMQNPSTVFKAKNLVPDSQKIIQLSLL